MSRARLFQTLLISLWLAGGMTARAQGTTFTYQGHLNDGTNPANGAYDLTFALFSVSNGVGQVGTALTNSATAVSNGIFTAVLDFGGNFPGAARWLEIGVRTNGNGAFVTLSPRQKFTATPYAITAGNITGTLAGTNLAGAYTAAVTFNNPSNSFTGNGTGLTNVNAITLNGVDTNGFWQTGGNSGVSPASGKFLGTSDGQALEFRVNNQRALLLVPAVGTPDFVAGGTNNQAGGVGNAIGGGGFNIAAANSYAAIPGGYSNSATGDYSFAAGQRAKATNQGAFVWADSQPADFSSTASNQFNLRAGGGVRIVTTNAANTNGVGMTLDGVPVLVGSGVGVLAWQLVAGTTKQMESHYGYILTNSQPVTLTLPLSASLNIGDVMRVAGGGSGGWKVAQNAGQSILAGNFTLINNPATAWSLISGTSPRSWRALAASADGNKLVAVVNGGFIYTSTDSGATWTQRGSSQKWTAVASSADGSKLAASANGGIYTSTDSGANWTARTNGNWGCVAASADGSRLVAGMASGNIYISANSGGSWTAASGTGGNWQALASSADGSVLLAGYAIGPIYFSIDSGNSWLTYGASINCTGVAIAADGGKFVAVENTGVIRISANAGNNWVVTGAPTANWSSIACSADGSKLAAGVAGGPIYISNNGGVTWKTAGASSLGWSAIASSSDGGKLSAAVSGGGIYTSLPAAQRTTTVGSAGFLSGGQNSAVELQYAGNNQFVPISHEGTVFGY